VTNERREPTKVLARLLGGLGDDRHLQTPANCLSDLSKWHALFCDRVIARSCRTFLQHQPVEMGGIEQVHGRKAVEAVANIGRDALLPG
jgi:hypothetical protein